VDIDVNISVDIYASLPAVPPPCERITRRLTTEVFVSRETRKSTLFRREQFATFLPNF
jgi:hypothetical protein